MEQVAGSVEMDSKGKIIILNGAPRSGKSSIVREIQHSFEGVWMNLGVDIFMKMTPDHLQPGIGLRPGGERPDLEPAIMKMYDAMYKAIAAISSTGLNVVTDVGHHDGYSVSRDILTQCAASLKDHDVLFVGVRCSIEEIMERRIATWGAGYEADGAVPKPVQRWQQLVHEPGIYDLKVDTSMLSSKQCADLIRQRLAEGTTGSAFQRIRGCE
ncbi:chloramphenicol phosphotransferase CPT family protein [Fictibacillus aquaticus]|uniref:Chloramphenicol phosphotransferase n=1 Tax=Fictibacillus aquaticus TaxID=2021314 RepID=A0A235FD38_9BACL|nr:chloramphenicol phosphotransferase [Fictibacillus aquaticus]OYD59300.1 chloramphenicol phosphotransferase [Fictibacillus aquaticus]